MGFFDRFTRGLEPLSGAVASKEVDAAAGPDVLTAPATGRLVNISEVPDPVFSKEVLGKGCAIWPEEDIVYAPVAGTVSVAMGHAVGIAGKDGVEVLVHIGVDTVNMKGHGFTDFVKQGDAVVVGQPVIHMDRTEIARSGYKDCVVMAVSNSAEFKDVRLAAEPGSHIEAGAAALQIVR